MARKVDSWEEFEAKKEAEFDSTSNYLEKQKRIKREMSRLKRQFKDIEPLRKNLVESTIADIAFMVITMQDLRENMIRDGTTVEYKNGENQYGTKQSPDAQLYLQFSQKHATSVKILLDCLPKSEKPAEEPDEKDLRKFVKRK